MEKGLIISLMILLMAIFTGAVTGQEAGKGRPFYMGFTPFPWDMTAEAVSATYQFITENGDIIAHHFEQGVPWTEALENKPFHPNFENDWKKRKSASSHKKVYVSVTPLNQWRSGMALYRGENENMPLPNKFKDRELDDPIVKKAYLNYCRRVVKYFHPDYFAIGIEVNELIHNSLQKWPHFVELYKYTYTELKKDYPDLPIFATVTLHNLTNPDWNLIVEQKKIQDFLQYSDIAGISYYSFMVGKSWKGLLEHSERPTKMLDWLREYTDNKPLAITETGYPAETIKLKTYNVTIPSDPAKQATYFETLLDKATQDNYLFVICFLYRDYDALWEKIKDLSPEAFIVWKDCGLIDEDGNQRPAYSVWKRYFSMRKI